MRHSIELTVTCDQAELDRLVRAIAEWAEGMHARNAAFQRGTPMRVHKLWMDGTVMWSGEPPAK